MKHTAAWERGMGVLLLLSLMVTVWLLVAEGNAAGALPLHLCSLSALAAIAAAFGIEGWPLDFLWYMGMPGALLALIFPAPASSRWQALLTASYIVTHALIVLIPLGLILRGERPRPGREPELLIGLQGMALLAFFVNRKLGTDFMFLSAPPAGTPLESVFRRGFLPYYLCLQGIMLACCLMMGRLLPGKKKKRSK